LREALVLANANADQSNITFAAGIADGTVVLTQGQLTLSTDLSISGDITIDADGASRAVRVIGGTSDVSGLTITGGDEFFGNGGGVSQFL